MKFEFEIKDEMIERAVSKAGKLNAWQLEMLANEVINNKIKAIMRKQLKDLNVEYLLEQVDWNKIVNNVIEQRMYDND